MDRHNFTGAMSRIVKALKMPKATPHDFRRTGGSNITGERIGQPRFIVGAILAYVDDSVTAKHYDIRTTTCHKSGSPSTRGRPCWKASSRAGAPGQRAADAPGSVTFSPAMPQPARSDHAVAGKPRLLISRPGNPALSKPLTVRAISFSCKLRLVRS
jgi:hypothetical protein